MNLFVLFHRCLRCPAYVFLSLMTGLSIGVGLVTAALAATALESNRELSFVSLRTFTGLKDPDEYYADERNNLTFGDCQFNVSPASLMSFDSVKSMLRRGSFYIEDTVIDLVGIQSRDEQDFWRSVSDKETQQRPILYLHGYNMSFARSCKQASLFEQNLDSSGRVILFSWPSDGALLNYTRDEVDAQWSAYPLERILQQMQQRFGAGGFDVVAHSLGARVLINALGKLANHRQPAMIGQLVLIAPDMDAGIFQQLLPSIQPMAGNISLYVSDNDKPLSLSEEVHGYARLGQRGAHLKQLKGIDIIDVSEIGIRTFSGHLYHLYHAQVENDLKLLLNDRIEAADRSTLDAVGSGIWKIRILEE